MNLSAMADFVCSKVRQTDTGAIARCKDFLRQRHDLIYNEALWKDSLYVFSFTFTPNAAGVPESWDSIKFMPSVVDRVIAVRVSSQDLSAGAQDQLIRGAVDQFDQSGSPAQFATLAPCVAILPSAYPFTDLEIYGGDAGTAYNATWIDGSGNRQTASGLLTGGDVTISTDARIVERVTKAATTADAVLSTNFTDVDLVRVTGAQTAWPARIPVRFFPIPSSATTFKALVKKKAISLVNDEDVPELRNLENALLAFAQGDMLEYGRQYGKANAKFQEGVTLLTQLKTICEWQEAREVRLVPDVGEVSGLVNDGFAGKDTW